MSEVSQEVRNYAPGAFVSPAGTVLAPWLVRAFERAQSQAERSSGAPSLPLDLSALQGLGEMTTVAAEQSV